MDLRPMFMELGLFAKLYLLGSLILVCTYLARHIWLHRLLWSLRLATPNGRSQAVAMLESHILGLRQAEHIALALGRALFAAELSSLLFLYTPVMRALDAQPWFAVPHFLIVCQLCFLPVLLLVTLDWLLSWHLRRFTSIR